MQLLNSVVGLEMLPAGQGVRWNKPRRKPCSRLRQMRIFLLTLLALVSFVPLAARAQVAGGSITGTIRGEPGTAVPGARVSITEVSSSAARAVITDADGFYNAP